MKFQYIFFVFLFLNPLNCIGQDVITDSLIWKAEMAADYPQEVQKLIYRVGEEELPADTLFDIYLNIVRGLINADPKGLLHFSNRFLDLATVQENEERKVDASNFKGLAYTNLAIYAEAELILKEALEKAESIEYPIGEGEANNLLGALAQRKAEYSEGIPFAERAIAIFKKIDNKKPLAVARSTLGNCYYGLAQFDKAIEYLIKAYEFLETGKEEYLTMLVAYNIAACYVSLANYEKAEEFAMACLALTENGAHTSMEAGGKNILGAIALREGRLEEATEWFEGSIDGYEKSNDFAELATVYSSLGSVYLFLGDPQKCLEWNEKALEIGEESNMSAILMPAYSSIGSAYAVLQEWDKSIQYLSKCLEICEQTGNQDYVRQLLHEIADTYSKKGDYEKAYEYYQRYHDKEHEVFTLDKEGQIAEIQTKYETEKKEKQIVVERLGKEKEKSLKQAAAGLAIIFALLATVFFFVARNRKKQKLLIEKDNLLFAEKNRLLKDDVNSLEDKLRTPEYFLQKSIFLTNRDKTILLLKDILYIKSIGNGVQIFTEKGSVIEWQHLKDMKALLPKEVFLQTHRSYIANVFHVKGKKAQTITMSNDHIVKIGNTLKEEVHRFLDAQTLDLS